MKNANPVRVALICVLLVGYAEAQQGKIRPVEGVVVEAHLDLKTGRITRGAQDRALSNGTVLDFDNLDLSLFVGVDTGNSTVEWLDGGVKGYNNNPSDIVTDLVLAYCSAKLDPSLGGVGGSVQLALYEGYTVGSPHPQNPVGVFNLVGLPAHGTDSSFNDSWTCYQLLVDLGAPFSLADGPIGYSWVFTDLGTDGVLAGTFPILGCVQGCAGPGPDNQGMVNQIDRFAPPGSFLDTLQFGGPGDFYTSIGLAIHEAADCAGTYAEYNCGSPNMLTAMPMVIGNTWTATLNVVAPMGVVESRLELKTDRLFSSPITITLVPGGPSITVAVKPLSLSGVPLIGGADFMPAMVVTHTVPGPPAVFSVQMPLSVSLFGRHWAAQAKTREFPSQTNPKLSSAVEGVVGNL